MPVEQFKLSRRTPDVARVFLVGIGLLVGVKEKIWMVAHLIRQWLRVETMKGCYLAGAAECSSAMSTQGKYANEMGGVEAHATDLAKLHLHMREIVSSK